MRHLRPLQPHDAGPQLAGPAGRNAVPLASALVLVLAGCGSGPSATATAPHPAAATTAPILAETTAGALSGMSLADLAGALAMDPETEQFRLSHAFAHREGVLEVYALATRPGAPPSRDRRLDGTPVADRVPLHFAFRDERLVATLQGACVPPPQPATGRLPYAADDFGALARAGLDAHALAAGQRIETRAILPAGGGTGERADSLLTGLTFGLFTAPLLVATSPFIAAGRAIDTAREEEAAGAGALQAAFRVGEPAPDLGVEVRAMPARTSPFGPVRAYGDPETDYSLYVFAADGDRLAHAGVRDGVVEWVMDASGPSLRPAMCAAAAPAYGKGLLRGVNCARDGDRFVY